MSILKKGDKKLINGWAMYDWANSVYSLTIATAVFPIYYEDVTKNDHGSTVMLFGREFVNTALYSYSLSAAFLIVAIISPLLSSIADFKRNKMMFMQMFCYIGSASCAALYFFDGDHVQFGLFAFVLAAIGFTGSIVFYNAYLPEIVSEEKSDVTSAKGFALGYIGSVILLIFNLVLIMMHDTFGLDKGLAAKIAFVSVGIWWAGFAQITFSALRRFEKGKPNFGINKSSGGSLFGGYAELRKVLHEIRKLPRLRNFLLAFFFYNMAVQTVMYIASLFGSKELKMETSHLIITVLIIQLVAIGGAYLYAFISKKVGNINAICIAIIMWILICVAAYMVQTEIQFIVIAFLVGTVMGGIQALSRSTYSKMLPETDDHASYFSFFDVTEKIAIVFGTITYGLLEEITGSMRYSILALILFFVVGLLILQTLRKKVIPVTVQA